MSGRTPLPGGEANGHIGGTGIDGSFPELKSLKLITDDGRRQRDFVHSRRRAPNQIAVPYLGTVKVWLLAGDPLTLVDTGPADDVARITGQPSRARPLIGHRARAAPPPPRSSRASRGVAAASGARIAATAGTAAGASYHERAALEAAFDAVSSPSTASPGSDRISEAFWEHIIRNSANFTTTDVLGDGDVVSRAVAATGSLNARDTVSPTLFVNDSAASRSWATTSCWRSPRGRGSAQPLGGIGDRRSCNTSRGSAHGGDGAHVLLLRPLA